MTLSPITGATVSLFLQFMGQLHTRPLNVNEDDMSGVKIIKIMSLIRLHIVYEGHMSTRTCSDILRT